MIDFSLQVLEVHWSDDKWFDLLSFELEQSPYIGGSLFFIQRVYPGTWQFDFLFYKFFRGLFYAIFNK